MKSSQTDSLFLVFEVCILRILLLTHLLNRYNTNLCMALVDSSSFRFRTALVYFFNFFLIRGKLFEFISSYTLLQASLSSIWYCFSFRLFWHTFLFSHTTVQVLQYPYRFQLLLAFFLYIFLIIQTLIILLLAASAIFVIVHTYPYT